MTGLIAAVHVGAMAVVSRIWHWLMLCVLVFVTVLYVIPTLISMALSGAQAGSIDLLGSMGGFFLLPAAQVFICYQSENYRQLSSFSLPVLLRQLKQSYVSLAIANVVLLGIAVTGLVFAGFIGYGLTHLLYKMMGIGKAAADGGAAAVVTMQHAMTIVAFVPVVYGVGRYALVPFEVIFHGQKVLESFELINKLVSRHRLFVFMILMMVYGVIVMDYVFNQWVSGLWAVILVNVLFGLLLGFYFVVAYLLYAWLRKQSGMEEPQSVP